MQQQNSERKFSALHQPAEETDDLYAGLIVCDTRVSGSITVGHSRLLLWAFVGMIVSDGWEAVVEDWPYMEEEYGWTRQKMSDFLHYAMQSDGEFGRLLLLMAEMNRRNEAADANWILDANNRAQMRQQLQRCLDALED